MITSVTIDRLRGIKHGEVPGLTGLSILVGPNGCGKSTVLDALLIGGSPAPGEALGRASTRRPATLSGLSWLFWQNQEGGPIEIKVEGLSDFDRTVVSRIDRGTATVDTGMPDRRQQIQIGVGVDNSFTVQSHNGVQRSAPDLRLFDPTVGPFDSLQNIYSDAARRGRASFAKEVLAELVAGFTGLEILTEQDRPVLYMNTTDRPIPVSLAGEGILALVRTVLHLANCANDGTALLEEPEVHQHPRSLRLMAQGICESVKRGVQVVLTTHSLELIENLVHFAGEAAITDSLSVHLLRLRENLLSATRLDGESARFQVQEMEADLR